MLTYDYLHRNSSALHRRTPWISKLKRWQEGQVQRWTACLCVNSVENMNTGAGLAKRMGMTTVRHRVVSEDGTHKHTAGAATCTRPSQSTRPPGKKRPRRPYYPWEVTGSKRCQGKEVIFFSVVTTDKWPTEERVLGSPGGGIAHCCELPGMGAGNWAQVLRKNRASS